MIEFFESLREPFMSRALIVGLLISICAALLGVILVLKRYSLIGHGLSDIGFASIALALALGLPPLTLSLPIVTLCSFLIMFISQKSGGKGDIAIGVVSTSSLALGILVMYFSGGTNADPTDYLFGSIMAVSNADLYLSVALFALVILVFLLFYNRLFMITYDENYAKSCNIKVIFYQFLISFLTALTVVIGMRMMGTLLISSLIIFPTISAKKLMKSFLGVIITSGIISVICFFAGLMLSYIINLPVGATIVMMNVIVMTISFTLSKIIKRV